MTRPPDDRGKRHPREAGDPGEPLADLDVTLADLDVTPIGEAMASLLKSRGLGATVVLAEVMSAWERAAGPELASRVKPVSLRHRELICEVNDPAWATQVRLLSETLLRRLAEEVGFVVADHLIVRVKRRSEG